MDLKKKYQWRDRAISVLSKSGHLRAVLVRNTNTILTAQQVHYLPPIAALNLGNALTAAAMMSIFLKGEERVLVDIRGDGVLSNVYAEAMHTGECRGYVVINDEVLFSPDASAENPPPVLGVGTIQVSRILYNQSEPITGIIPLQFSGVAKNVANYFFQSEQIETSLILDVDFKKDRVVSAGGFMVQAMPGLTDEEMETMQNAFAELRYQTDFNEMLLKHESLETLMQAIFPFEFDVLKTRQIDFFCRCNAENYKSYLLMFPIKELRSMQEAGHNELVCKFCNKKYYLTNEDLESLIIQKMAATN